MMRSSPTPASPTRQTNRGRLMTAPAHLSVGDGPQLVQLDQQQQNEHLQGQTAQSRGDPQVDAKRRRPRALADDSHSGEASSDSELSEAESVGGQAAQKSAEVIEKATTRPSGSREKKRARFALPALESGNDASSSMVAPRRSSRAAIVTEASAPPSRSTSPVGAQEPSYVVLARHCVATLASSYDVDGLLASAIVFHRTATISATEACRSVLSSTPGLLRGQVGPRAPVTITPSASSEGTPVVLSAGQAHPEWPSDGAMPTFERFARKAWIELLESVLHSPEAPHFGTIQRAGKDSAGNPLENWFYYDKDKDHDKERAESLGAFVKPIRQALKTQKAVFWKKVSRDTRQCERTKEEEEAIMANGVRLLPSPFVCACRPRARTAMSHQPRRSRSRAQSLKSALPAPCPSSHPSPTRLH